MLCWGTPAALFYAFLTASIFPLDPRRSTTAQVIYELVFFECVAVAAAIIAASLPIGLWSSSARRSVFVGIACVVVASFAPVVFASFYDCQSLCGYYRSHPAAFINKLGLDLQLGALLVAITHVCSFFFPEILGGICGYRIFEHLKPRPE